MAYTTKSYHLFKELHLPFKIIYSDIDTGTTGCAEPTCVFPGIASKDVSSVVPQYCEQQDADILDSLHAGFKIELINKRFVIRMEYNKRYIVIIKSLQAAWWHQAEKVWLAKATLANLELLQKEFKYWSDTEYDKVRDLVSLVEFPRKVELYKTLDSPGNIWVKLNGYGIDVDFLKHMPERTYDQRFKRWSIPNDTRLIDRVIAHYEKQHLAIVNRIPMPVRNTRNLYHHMEIVKSFF